MAKNETPKDYTKFSAEEASEPSDEVLAVETEPAVEPLAKGEDLVIETVSDPRVEMQYGDICTVVKCSSLNVRQKPMADARVVTIVPAGTQLSVKAVVGAWTHVHVLSDPDRRGFVMNEYIKKD